MRKIFVRCGRTAKPPDEQWEIVELPDFLSGSEDVLEAVIRVKELVLASLEDVRLLIAGPIVLGVAVGQALEHAPVKVEYVQLNQRTKRFEIWWDNTRHV